MVINKTTSLFLLQKKTFKSINLCFTLRYNTNLSKLKYIELSIQKSFMGYLAQFTMLSPEQVIYVKRLMYLTCLGHCNGSIKTTEDFLNIYGPMMIPGGKYFQHTLFTLYPHIKFSLEDVRLVYPKVQVESGKTSYDLSDIFNIVTVNRLKNEPIFHGDTLSIQVTPEEFNCKKFIFNSIPYLNTKQAHPDILWLCQMLNFYRYLDEKKGQYNAFSGHVHFIDEGLIEQESKKFCNSQFASLQEFSIQNKGAFAFILKDLAGILGNQKASWKDKNFLFQEVLKKNIIHLPQNKVPSFLFESQYSYEQKVSLNDKRFDTMQVKSNSFSNIAHTQEALALSIQKLGKKTADNLINSTSVCSKIKQMILNNMKNDFGSWSGFGLGDS